MPPLDLLQRPWRSLRISVTDRCNLRCRYCMPLEEYTWLPREDLLRFEEIAAVARAARALGVSKLRLTGGEPLLRRGLWELVACLAAIEGLEDLALTTNGIGLKGQARDLRLSGLGRVTISLDTLRRDRFVTLCGRDALHQVLDGIAAAREVGFAELKFNTVVMRGVNDDELEALADFAWGTGAQPRFIEYMDVGGAVAWRAQDVVDQGEILERLTRRLGPPVELSRGTSPARRWRFPDGRVVGIIASTTQPFCGSCDRGRLTADGVFLLCLYARAGLDLRTPLRQGCPPEELARLLSAAWGTRRDRGAEERQAMAGRGALASAADLAADPHLEMHTRGG